MIAPSRALAEEVERLGAREVRTIPNGIDLPEAVGEEADPPEILYAGRLSPEKGVLELVAAAAGMPLVVAGDGPLRDEVPGALGFVPHDELERLYGRAAVVACPSRREGFGVVCAEAMAHGRPVVAGDVGGLRDLVVDEETGLLVPPGDVGALRDALQRLLADPGLRRRLGEAGRARIAEHFTWQRFGDETLRAYEDALATKLGAMLVAKIVFWFSLAALVWTHVGYALAAALAARVRRRRVQTSEIEPSASIVVAAHDESDVIEQRVRNLLDLDYPPDLIEVVVASDASTDGTDEAVERLAAEDPRVKLVRCERGGKVAAQNRGVGAVQR